MIKFFPLILIASLAFAQSPSLLKITKSQGLNKLEATQINKDTISAELKRELDNEFRLWYPLCLDTEYGGYYSDINYKWELDGEQTKMIVTQSRHIWSNAYAALFYKTDIPYKHYAEHGLKFLRDVMWDKKYGGFYNLVDREGNVIKENGKIIKQAYGISFAIYGLAAYYKAFHDTAALNLAKETFYWLEKHSYDPEYGGYFQFLSQDGIPFKDGYGETPPKDQNTSIHLLECFSELYSVWPDSKLKERLNSMLHIIRDTVIGSKKYMTLFFKRDWTPVSFQDASQEVREKNYEFDHISFGHDVETAYLMLEASKELGIENDSATIRVAKELDDFTLQNGWDIKNGGIYDRGYIFKGDKEVTIIRNAKEWWCQIEALNSFLLMSKLFPDAKENYYEKFCLEWEHIKRYLIDPVYGGWFWDSIDTSPDAKLSHKGSIWKATYHTARGLMNSINQLKNEK